MKTIQLFQFHSTVRFAPSWVLRWWWNGLRKISFFLLFFYVLRPLNTLMSLGVESWERISGSGKKDTGSAYVYVYMWL